MTLTALEIGLLVVFALIMLVAAGPVIICTRLFAKMTSKKAKKHRRRRRSPSPIPDGEDKEK